MRLAQLARGRRDDRALGKWKFPACANRQPHVFLTDEGQSEAAQSWLLWAEGYRQTIDPLTAELTMPDIPEPKADDLEPFLGGWSFYGPHPGRW